YCVRAKSIINKVDVPWLAFAHSINVYRGCSHACVYCFARPTHTYLGFDAGRDFEKEIVVKVNAPEVLRAELARPSWERELVALGTNTDPYQWVESRYRLTRGILEALDESGTPVSVLTKSPLVLSDMEIFKRMAKSRPIRVNLSIPTMDEDAWRATEPHTPSPKARMEAVAELRRNGISSGILVAPLMPGINERPDQVEPILEAAYEADADFVTPIALNLRKETRDVFFEWLEATKPDLVERYEKLFPRGRGRLPKVEQTRITAAVREGRLRHPGRTDRPAMKPRDIEPPKPPPGAASQKKLF
ncbi:MAG: radical SAM protein, partial [Solirubrobacterales bacterium]